MKFNKQFSAYVETQKSTVPGLSYVEFKLLKKVLKHCPLHHSSSSPSSPAHCPPSCPVCDQTFFPMLMKEVEGVLGCLSERVHRLLQFHLASGVSKYILRLRYGSRFANHQYMILEGQKLVSYVYMNSLAIRKILKKYDKVHLSKKGRAFKSRLQTLHAELLQSPWLVELIAMHLNLEESKPPVSELSAAKCAHDFDGAKPTISYMLSDSVTVEIDLNCSICLEMVFDPVSLGCGHIFCNSCACSAASVATIAGLKTADPRAKCPLCRQARVYENAVHLTELGTLIRTTCKDYWAKRLQRERLERVEQAKEHWNNQCRAALGM